MPGSNLRHPVGTVDGGRAQIGNGFAEAVLVLPAAGQGLLALPRRDVILFFGVIGRRVLVYDRSGTEVGYGVWEGNVFQIYAGEGSPLEIPAEDLRGAVRALPKAGTVYRSDYRFENLAAGLTGGDL